MRGVKRAPGTAGPASQRGVDELRQAISEADKQIRAAKTLPQANRAREERLQAYKELWEAHGIKPDRSHIAKTLKERHGLFQEEDASSARLGESPLESIPSIRHQSSIPEEVAEETIRELQYALALLEGRVQPGPLDIKAMALQGRQPPILSEDFLNFRKGSEAIVLPPEGTELRRVLEMYSGEGDMAEDSYLNIEIMGERNIAVISNLLYLPPEMNRRATLLAGHLRKVLESGNPERISTAWGCWLELKASLETQSQSSEIALSSQSSGKGEIASIFMQLSRTYGIIAEEMHSRIETLAKGREVSLKSIEATTPMQTRAATLLAKAAKLEIEEALSALTGTAAIEKINHGIEQGIYSQAEIAMYLGISGQLKASMGRIQGFTQNGLRQVSINGYDGLAGWQKEEVEKSISLVAQLESIAWKVDLNDRIRALEAGGPPQTGSLSRLVTSRALSVAQLTSRSRGEMRQIGRKAGEHISYVKGLINGAGDFSQEEKMKYSEELNELSKKAVIAQTPPELLAVSRKLAEILNNAEMLLAERALDKQASDKENPWNVRASAYTKQYVLSHALEIMGASAAVGGVVGAVAGRNPAAAWAGAKAGASAGQLIVAAAGAFVTSDAMYRYISGTGDIDRAVADIRLGSTYMLFGLGGGPVAAISAPVKTIAGGGAALSNSILLYNDIRSGNYLEMPADVAYVAIGSVAFLRTASGAFRAIRLKTSLGSSLAIANSTGAARVAIKARDQIASISARAQNIGYSPAWVGLNAVFGGLSQWNNLSAAIDNGDYSRAARSINRGFADITRAMVGFDFAIFGIGGTIARGAFAGGARAVRHFRVSVPASQAREVQVLAGTPLYENLCELARRGRVPGRLGPVTNERLLELAFARGGNVTPEYVQATLGMESRAIAAEISKEISTSWSLARRIVAGGARTGKAIWNRTSRLYKRAASTRAGKIAAMGAKGTALVGAVAYIEFKHARQEMLSRELDRLTTRQDQNFINQILANSSAEFKTRQFEMGSLIEAMGLCNQISDGMDDGVHPLSNQMGLGGNIEYRKKLLLSGAVSLLMEGKEVNDRNLSSLISTMNSLFVETGIQADENTPLSTLSFMGSIALREGTSSFADAYRSMSLNVPQNELFAYLDYITASYYCASSLGRSVDWASDVSFEVFEAFKEEYRKNKSYEGIVQGWWLVFTFQGLEAREPSHEEILDIAKMAYNRTLG